MTTEQPPAELRRAIVADLVPAPPIAPPLRRALLLLPLALVLAVLPPIVFGVRRDAGALGPVLLWGLSLVQVVIGFLLLVAALREAVPGRAVPFSPGLLVSGLAAALAVTWLTWSESLTVVPPGRVLFFWRICFVSPTLLGLPLVFVALWLALRAYPLRPALMGALAGLGAGLVTDAGWRTFCHVADPRHVVSAHVAAVVALSVAGTLMAVGLRRRPD